jgi:hypothetical protein
MFAQHQKEGHYDLKAMKFGAVHASEHSWFVSVCVLRSSALYIQYGGAEVTKAWCLSIITGTEPPALVA